MSSSLLLVEHLKPIFSAVRRALLTQPAALAVFLPIFRGETIPADSNSYEPRSYTAHESDGDLSTLLSFFRDEFPQPTFSSLGLWQGTPKAPMLDPTTMAIHGRLAMALSQPQSPRNVCLLRFIVVVIILHQLAHAISCRFPMTDMLCLEHNSFPYYFSGRFPPLVRFPEQGFSVEEGLFGGMVGVVFENEVDGSPPMFFQSDFTRISHLFLHCRDGSTYRLNPSDLEDKMNAGRLTPFNVSELQTIPLPKRLCDRTCAMFNGDHLTVHESEGGDPEPEPNMSLFQPPVERKCGIHRPTPQH